MDEKKTMELKSLSDSDSEDVSGGLVSTVVIGDLSIVTLSKNL